MHPWCILPFDCHHPHNTLISVITSAVVLHFIKCFSNMMTAVIATKRMIPFFEHLICFNNWGIPYLSLGCIHGWHDQVLVRMVKSHMMANLNSFVASKVMYHTWTSAYTYVSNKWKNPRNKWQSSPHNAKWITMLVVIYSITNTLFWIQINQLRFSQV